MGYLVRYYLRINNQKKYEVLSIFKVTLIKIEIFKFSESVFKNKVERDRVQRPILSADAAAHIHTNIPRGLPFKVPSMHKKRLHSS